MVFRFIFLLMLIFGWATSSSAQVAVPVYDMIAETQNVIRHQDLVSGVADSSTQISTQISNSAKAQAQLQSEINRQNAQRQAMQYISEQKRKNAERHSPKFGAKVKDACAMVKAAQEVHSGQLAKKRIFNQSVQVANKYFERGKYRSPNEPAKTGEAASLLTKFQKINEFERARDAQEPGASMIDNSLSLSTSRDENGRSEYSIEHERKIILLNPFSDKLTENFDSPNQPASMIPNSAHAKWKIEMTKAINRNEMYLLANKATTFSDGWATSLFEASEQGVSMKNLALGEAQKQGYYATLDVINKARTFNPDWSKYTNNGMTERALMADANMIAAQSLVNQSEIIRLLVMLNENMHLSFSNDSRYYWKTDSTSTTPQ